ETGRERRGEDMQQSSLHQELNHVRLLQGIIASEFGVDVLPRHRLAHPTSALLLIKHTLLMIDGGYKVHLPKYDESNHIKLTDTEGEWDFVSWIQR
ncbi:hypothetical protein ATANTOWER_002425, partial [Ataeniobius toweri]|nr:hypothetical protein [Ataeniobius toweri]